MDKRLPQLFGIFCLLLVTKLGLAGEREEPAQVLESARMMLAEKKAEEAFTLLMERETEWSGNDDYDYLLGVAALDSKHSGEAIFSLQRLVARRPAFAGARLELARAYFDAGDNELARIEFERLASENPPKKVEAAVESYLEAIDRRARTYTSTTQIYIDMATGYDTNAPAATDDDQFFNFTLSPNNVEQDSTFGQVGAGVVWNKPVSPDSQVLLTGNVSHRSNPSAHFVDPTIASVGAMWMFKQGVHSARVGANGVATWLDGDSNKQDLGLTGVYQYNLTDAWRLNATARYGALRYEDFLSIQDVDQLTLGVGAEQMSREGTYSLSLVAGQDEEKEPTSRFGNDSIGVRASKTWFSSSTSRLTLSGGVTRVEYDEPFFGLDREDDLFSIALRNTWARFPSRGWTLTAQISYSQKDSSISLYEYDRIEAGLFLRRVFN